MDSPTTANIKEQIAAIEEEYNREDETTRKQRENSLERKRAQLDLELKLLRETLESEIELIHPVVEAKQIIENMETKEARRRKDAETTFSTDIETKETRDRHR